MDISIEYGDALWQATPLLVLGTWEDEALPHAVAGLVEAEDWTGRLKQTLTLIDSPSDAALWAALRADVAGHSLAVLTVAHRLTTARAADRVDRRRFGSNR